MPFCTFQLVLSLQCDHSYHTSCDMRRAGFQSTALHVTKRSLGSPLLKILHEEQRNPIEFDSTDNFVSGIGMVNAGEERSR